MGSWVNVSESWYQSRPAEGFGGVPPPNPFDTAWALPVPFA